AQLFDVNYQMSAKSDPAIRGYNLRASARLKLEGSAPIPFKVTPFVNAAKVTNDVLNATSGLTNQLLETPYDGLSLSGGVDLSLFDRSGIGVSYAQVRAKSPAYVPASASGPARDSINDSTYTYLNVGATYWITDHVALGARYARYSRVNDGKLFESDASYFGTLRMAL
ncbi:MAG: hypothetical protein WBV82_04685, partial [Myxococcaceae bacterium]